MVGINDVTSQEGEGERGGREGCLCPYTTRFVYTHLFLGIGCQVTCTYTTHVAPRNNVDDTDDWTYSGKTMHCLSCAVQVAKGGELFE